MTLIERPEPAAMRADVAHVIFRRTGEVHGVPRGKAPTVMIELDPHDQIIDFECKPVLPVFTRTVRWRWTAWIVTKV